MPATVISYREASKRITQHPTYIEKGWNRIFSPKILKASPWSAVYQLSGSKLPYHKLLCPGLVLPAKDPPSAHLTQCCIEGLELDTSLQGCLEV